MIGQTIHLQFYGTAPAQKAEDFNPGDITLWNYGEKAKILSIVKETTKTITWELSIRRGTYKKQILKKRLVGMARTR